MDTNNLLKQVAFIKEIDKLKYIQRRTKLFNSNRHENDAEHSWHLAMMAIEFNVPYHTVYNKKKAIKNGSATIWNYAEQLLNESVEKGILRKETPPESQD